MKLDWRGVLGIGITVFLLWWLLRGEDLGLLGRSVLSGDPWLLLGSVTVATLGFLIRAFRWKVLLHPIRPDTGLRSRFAATNIGFMANNLLPARIGEFVRAYALSRMEPVSLSGAFGSLVVERFLDLITILTLLLVAVLSPGVPAGVTVAGVPLAAAMNWVAVSVGAILVALFLLVFFPRQIVGFAERVAHHLPGKTSRLIVDVLEAFLQGLEVLRSPRLLVLAFLWSFTFWCWQGLAFWLGFFAYGVHVPYTGALLVNALVAFAVAVPSSPGFVGTFHAGVTAGLHGVYGVAETDTLALAFGVHAVWFVPVTLIGLYYAWRLGLSLKEVESSEERVGEDVEREGREGAGDSAQEEEP